MAFVPVPDAALAVVEWSTGPLSWTNTLWFIHPTFGNNELIALGNLVAAWADSYIAPELSQSVTRGAVTIYDMRTSDGAKLVFDDDPASGNEPTPPSPLNGAMVVTFYTGGRGRSSRGRNYVTGFGEADVSTDTYTTQALLDAIELAYQNLQSLAAAQSWVHVIVQKYQDGVALTEGIPHPVVSYNVRSGLLGSQRRRIPRP